MQRIQSLFVFLFAVVFFAGVQAQEDVQAQEFLEDVTDLDLDTRQLSGSSEAATASSGASSGAYQQVPSVFAAMAVLMTMLAK